MGKTTFTLIENEFRIQHIFDENLLEIVVKFLTNNCIGEKDVKLTNLNDFKTLHV